MAKIVDNMLHHKIVLLKTLMIVLGIGISIMSIIRYHQGLIGQSIADGIFVVILLISLYKLKKNPKIPEIKAIGLYNQN